MTLTSGENKRKRLQTSMNAFVVRAGQNIQSAVRTPVRVFDAPHPLPAPSPASAGVVGVPSSAEPPSPASAHVLLASLLLLIAQQL